jgi:hypothetical protein
MTHTEENIWNATPGHKLEFNFFNNPSPFHPKRAVHRFDNLMISGSRGVQELTLGMGPMYPGDADVRGFKYRSTTLRFGNVSKIFSAKLG